MRGSRPLRALLTALLTVTAAAGVAGTASGGAAAAQSAATPLPAHVFAPYFEAYNGDSPAALAQQSGAKYLTMAFLQTEKKGSCTPYWNGETSQPVSAGQFGADFTTIRSRGGDVIPSFGGFAADNGGTEIADSCTDVDAIAAAYEKVITTYEVSRLDMDIEDNSLTNTAAIDRRNQAIKKVQDWAAANGRQIQVSYTLPTTTSGLAGSGLAVLRSAKAAGAKVDVVNLMTFDYYDGQTHHMATDTQTAATGLQRQLATLYPDKSASQLWGMVGVTEMPGIDDYGPEETFTTADATAVESWAVAQGINTLSFWALQRDNGGCPGTGGSDTCSGIAQDTWQFTHTFAPFTSGSTQPPQGDDFSVSLAPAAATVAPGASVSASAATAVTSGSAKTVALTASGLPGGVTAAFTPSSVTAGASAQLKLSATAATAPGTYTVKVTGTAGSTTHSANLALTVSGPGGGTTLTNGDLESGALAPWSCQSGGAVVTSPAHGGGHALRVTPSAAQTGQCGQSVTLAPNTHYTLSGWVRGAYAYLGVSGGATANAWTSSSDWTKLSVPFTTGASGTVTVYLHGWYGQAEVYGDDFQVS